MILNATQLANRNIVLGRIKSDSQSLLDLIKEDNESKYKEAMRLGNSYFKVENTKITNPPPARATYPAYSAMK